MAKQTEKSFLQSFQILCKFEKYCQDNFGMSFMEKMESRILQVRKEFTGNILEQIKEAEREYDQDYLEIKE